MNKTETTLLVILGLVLLAILGLATLKYQGTGSPQATVSQTVSSPDLQTPTGTVSSTALVSANPISVTVPFEASTSVTVPKTAGSVSAPGPSATVSPAVIIPEAGWTVYRDGQYAVAGTYPDSWYEYDAVSLGGSLQFMSAQQGSVTDGGFVVNGQAEITVYRAPETVTQARAEDSLNGTQQGIVQVIVDGQSVPVISYNIDATENTLVTYVAHDGYVYRIILSDHGESQFSPIYTKFLASFRFTD